MIDPDETRGWDNPRLAFALGGCAGAMIVVSVLLVVVVLLTWRVGA